MVNVRSREFPKSVLQADTIIVSCGLANFERTSWSTHRRHEFCVFYEELDTGADYDKFVGSFEDNYPGMWNGHSIWMIDCRKFDDPGRDKSLRNHIGRNPRIMKSIMESKNYHELQRRLYYRMPRFFSRKNIVIMICRSGRHRSVENAALWSNTLARYSRHQHSVSLLHLSELDFRKIRVRENVRNAVNSLTRIFQTHYDRIRAECSRLDPVSESETGHRKRSRSENFSESPTGNKSLVTHAESWARSAKDSLDEEDHLLQTSKKRATSATSTLAGTNLNRDILDELAERLENFHDSARALASCLQTRDVTRKSDQSMIEAAECMFHKLLGEANDDLECVTPQSRERLHVETTRNKHRCSRSETPIEKPYSCSETTNGNLSGRRQQMVCRFWCRFHRHHRRCCGCCCRCGGCCCCN